MTDTPLQRALLVVLLPVWLPLLLAVAVIGLCIYVPTTLIWCSGVRLVSWVLYGDDHMLGRWWWPFDFTDDREMREHRYGITRAKEDWERKRGRGSGGS